MSLPPQLVLNFISAPGFLRRPQRRIQSGDKNSGARIWAPPRPAPRGRGQAGPGGARRGGAGERREVVEVRGDARPPARPGLASGCSLRLFPAPSPRQPVLPSPPVQDGNTMAAAAQLSLTQVTPPASPPGSDGRCPRPPPPPSYGSPTWAVSLCPWRGGRY